MSILDLAWSKEKQAFITQSGMLPPNEISAGCEALFGFIGHFPSPIHADQYRAVIKFLTELGHPNVELNHSVEDVDFDPEVAHKTLQHLYRSMEEDIRIRIVTHPYSADEHAVMMWATVYLNDYLLATFSTIDGNTNPYVLRDINYWYGKVHAMVPVPGQPWGGIYHRSISVVTMAAGSFKYLTPVTPQRSISNMTQAAAKVEAFAGNLGVSELIHQFKNPQFWASIPRSARGPLCGLVCYKVCVSDPLCVKFSIGRFDSRTESQRTMLGQYLSRYIAMARGSALQPTLAKMVATVGDVPKRSDCSLTWTETCSPKALMFTFALASFIALAYHGIKRHR